MNLSLPRLAAIASIFTALMTGVPAFAHQGHHASVAPNSRGADASYVPYMSQYGDPLGVTLSNPGEFDDEATGSIANGIDYLPYLRGVGDPLGLTSSR